MPDQNPWDVPITAPMVAQPPAMVAPQLPQAPQPDNSGGLASVLMKLFGLSTNAQPPALQGVVGGGQGPVAIDPLQQAARQQQVQQTFASR